VKPKVRRRTAGFVRDQFSRLRCFHAATVRRERRVCRLGDGERGTGLIAGD
jgi:hypothetical protein